jgi:hypothetical protein
LNEELKKLGLRVRPRKVGGSTPTQEQARQDSQTQSKKPGEIGFDDRGNAVFEWGPLDLGREGEDGDHAHSRALDHPGLSLMDDDGPVNAPMRNNLKGMRQGYNPYESGLLSSKDGKKKKTDLRELSKWIEEKRRAQGKTDEEPET